MAIQRNVAILILHHTRKTAGADPVEEVSGTYGLAGGVDTIWLLKRQRNCEEGTLQVTGRDVKEQELSLSCKDGRWSYLGPKKEWEPASETNKILQLFTEERPVWSNADLALELGKPANTVKVHTWRMHKDGLLEKQGNNWKKWGM
jgi:hypothetical protein